MKAFKIIDLVRHEYDIPLLTTGSNTRIKLIADIMNHLSDYRTTLDAHGNLVKYMGLIRSLEGGRMAFKPCDEFFYTLPLACRSHRPKHCNARWIYDTHDGYPERASTANMLMES